MATGDVDIAQTGAYGSHVTDHFSQWKFCHAVTLFQLVGKRYSSVYVYFHFKLRMSVTAPYY